MTLAQEVSPPERIEPPARRWPAGRVDVTARPGARAAPGDRTGSGCRSPIAGSGPPAVVGRGGIEVELTVTARPDPEAAALLAVDGAADGDGRCRGDRPHRRAGSPARRGGGRAARWRSSPTSPWPRPTASQGIGRKVLAAVEAEAAARGCDVVLVAAPGEGAAAALLAGAGWQAAGDAVADGRRLWRREFG